MLQALLRWGPESAIPRFNGMFALSPTSTGARPLSGWRGIAWAKPLFVAERAGELLSERRAPTLGRRAAS